MKKNLKRGFLIGMVFLAGNTFGQVEGSGSDKIKNTQETRTYFNFLLNVVNTNINYGKSNSSLEDYKKSNFGAQVGASFQAGINPNLSLVSEFYFIMKGGQLKADNPLTEDKSTLRFYELELPVLARFHVGNFYVNAGPTIGLNLYGTRKTEGSISALSFNDSKKGFKRIDAGLQMGAGYGFNINKKSVVLDARYTYGLSNISNDQEMYNRYLNISLRLSNPWKTNPLGRK